jgi:acyl dehydratase
LNTRVISTYGDLRAVLGQDLGPGRWFQISKEQVRLFEMIRSPGLFVSVQKGSNFSTWGPAYADGSLLLAFLGRLRSSIEAISFNFPSQMNIFYGFDRIRFFDPVRVPTMVRLHLKVVEVKPIDPKIIHVVYGHRLETDDGRTALIADAINRIYLK